MRTIIFVLLLLILASPIRAAEQVDLTSPHVADPRQTSTLRVNLIILDWTNQKITIGIGGNDVTKHVVYSGSEAGTLMTSLNKANLSTKSLHRRIMERLITDGHLNGTITGTPD